MQGLPAPLALTAGVVAIKVLSTAACRQNAATGAQASSFTACLQQLLLLASRLVEATANNADSGIGPDELQWMSVCCANAGNQNLQGAAVAYSLCTCMLSHLLHDTEFHCPVCRHSTAAAQSTSRCSKGIKTGRGLFALQAAPFDKARYGAMPMLESMQLHMIASCRFQA